MWPSTSPPWELHLRAERRSPETVRSYGDGVRRFLAWTDGEGRRPLHAVGGQSHALYGSNQAAPEDPALYNS